MKEKEELFEKIAEMPSLVDISVVLEDLSLLDADNDWWPREIRRRLLAESLLKRRFFASLEESYTMSDLWIRLKEHFGLKHFHHTRILISEYQLYREASKAKAV